MRQFGILFGLKGKLHSSIWIRHCSTKLRGSSPTPTLMLMISRKLLNLIVIVIVGLGMPAYYKIKYLILDLITLEDILNWTLPVEILFGVLLASSVIFGHDLLVSFLRSKFSKDADNRLRFSIQYVVSTIYAVIIAIVFSKVFWDYIMNMPISIEYIFDYALLGLIIPLLVNGISESLFFYGRWEKESAEKEKLAAENLKTKYEVLQNQVNPHFLFNCLNTLGVLINESKRAASEFLSQMSKVYRYILEVKNQEVVTIKMELDALKSYASLMKHRFGSSFQVKLPTNYNSNVYLAPLTLQMLMENVLKHNQVSNESPIHIHLDIRDKYLSFSNSIISKSQPIDSTKTGLQNLSQRYALLSENPVKIINNSEKFEVLVPLIEILNA